MKPDICLGTAQFGLDYGVTNSKGKVSEETVSHILSRAASCGIHWIDTAQAYGESEAVLGRALPQRHTFRVITKLNALSKEVFTSDDIASWENSLKHSLERLRVKKLDALLVHSPADLRKLGSAYLQEWLLCLRSRGLVSRLGVSIYTAADLDGVCDELQDIVQMPLSLFDQRLLQDGTVSRLRAKGTVLHARSIYMQGLLLIPAEQWPSWISDDMKKHQKALERLSRERGHSLIDMAVGFAKEQTDFEAIVVGMCSEQELLDLHRVWIDESPWQEGEWRDWAMKDASSLDPRRWEH